MPPEFLWIATSNRIHIKVIWATFFVILLCFNTYEAHIFRTQSNLEAPPNRERVPINTKTRGHGPFETPRGKIKIGPFSGLTDEQVLQDDGSSNHRSDHRQNPPIVMFDIFNFYKSISTLMFAASQALERLWDIVEHLLLSLITHSDPKLDQPHDPNNTQVSGYFLSWAIIASIVMLFAFCAKRYFLNPIFQRWDREQELKLSRFLGGSGQHSKVGPSSGTCLNNNSSVPTPTGGKSKRFTKCTTISSNSFSSARWANQCLENIFYVPTVRQRFLNAWLLALNQHCSLVGPQVNQRLSGYNRVTFSWNFQTLWGIRPGGEMCSEMHIGSCIHQRTVKRYLIARGFNPSLGWTLTTH